MLKWAVILLAVVVVVMIFKNMKHNIVKEGLKYAIVILLIVAGFLAVNYFYDLDDVVEGGKGLVEMTGAAIGDAYEESFDTNIWEEVKEDIGGILDR